MNATLFTMGVMAAVVSLAVAEPARSDRTKLDARPLERHVCGVAAPRASNDTLASLHIMAETGRVVRIVVTSDGTFEPAVIVDTDDVDTAKLGWFHEIGGTGATVDTTVVLPVRGVYSVSITDRRAELPEGPRPSCADVQITTVRLPQTLPMPPSWYGAVHAPVTFDVSRVDPHVQVVSVENLSKHGVLMASVFEGGVFRDMSVIAPLEARQFAIGAFAISPRLIVEQAMSMHGEALESFVTTAPYELAPDVDEQYEAAVIQPLR